MKSFLFLCVHPKILRLAWTLALQFTFRMGFHFQWFGQPHAYLAQKIIILDPENYSARQRRRASSDARRVAS